MAVVKKNSYTEAPLGFCICYKVSGLRGTILDSNKYKTAHLNDQYVIGQQLGWGQFGVIRECVDKFSGEVLACKSIAKERLVTHEDIQSIKLEIEIMTKLSGHPNVVELKAVYEEEDYVHLVMELCAGGELFHKLEKHGRFPEPEARVVFRHLIQVVMYCHDKGIVHRDLKPENILLATKSSSSPIKLADFGLATYISPGQSLHGTVGSPFYIAPEVLSGGYNQAADVWSAGVILYILLSGIPPFWGKTKSQIFDAVRAADLRFPSNQWDFLSDSAKDLIRRMLCKDTSRRLTAREVLDHYWVTDIPPLVTTRKVGEQNLELDFDQDCLTSPLMARHQDISFGMGSSIISDNQLPSFTCKSSFYSLGSPSSTPSLEAVGFSFRCNASSNTIEASTPIIALPSFAFFNAVGQENDVLHFPNSSGVDIIPTAIDMDPEAVKVKNSRSGVTRIMGIHSRRNHTIGASEFENFGLMVTESIIRWASCTRLQTTTSLGSSLVC